MGCEVKAMRKKVEELTPADLAAFPVWEFGDEDGPLGDTAVHPVELLPVDDLSCRIVGTEVVLSNGQRYCASLGNVDLTDYKWTQNFLVLSVWAPGGWYHLARYRDPDFERRGPSGLAAFLGLSVEQVFPISYDISKVCIGDPSVIVGQIPQVLSDLISEEDSMRLLMPKLSQEWRRKNER